MKNLIKFIAILMVMINMTKADDNLIPREVIFSNPDRIAVRISPNGKYISYLAPYEDKLNIWIAPIGQIDQAKRITDVKRSLRSYKWAQNNQYILYSQDGDGDENWCLHSVDIDSQEEQKLTPEKGVQARLLGISKFHPDHILVMHNERLKEYFDVYKIDLRTGETKLVFENNQKYVLMYFDKDFQPLLAGKMTNDGDQAIYRLDRGDKPELFLEIAGEDMLTTHLYHVTNDKSKVYLADGAKTDLPIIFEMDMETKEKKLFYEPRQGEIFSYFTEQDNYEILAVAEEHAKPKWYILDDSIRADFEKIDQYRGDNEMSIVSRTKDDDKWIIAINSSHSPVHYYLYDRKKDNIKFLLTANAEQEKYQFAEMKPVIIPTRDGLEMVSYLTLPTHAGSWPNIKRKVPLIMLVHGGPNLRDSWMFDPEVQLLANRGYGVLQVNYRGSAGFGKKFVNAGDGEWGEKMQRDIDDGANWAISQGITDKDNIAILGGSYGGYATLRAVTQTPEKYVLGVDICGIANLETHKDSIPAYWKGFSGHFNKMMGRDAYHESAAQFLRERSPINYINNITKPLMIIQGANDPRVVQAESDQMAEAMQKNDIPVLYLLYPDEGHGITRLDNRLSMYAYIEAFLAKYLGGRSEPIKEYPGSTMQIKAGQEMLEDK